MWQLSFKVYFFNIDFAIPAFFLFSFMWNNFFFPLPTFFVCGFIYFKEIIINVQNEFNLKDVH